MSSIGGGGFFRLLSGSCCASGFSRHAESAINETQANTDITTWRRYERFTRGGLPRDLSSVEPFERDQPLRVAFASSSSSRVLGQSSFINRDSDRSARRRPSVWHVAQ